MDVCELPLRPSHLIGMPEAGYPPEACLDFDREAVRVSRRLRRMAQETVPAQVKAPDKAHKGMVWSQRPKYGRAELLAAYGVDPGNEAEAEAVGERVAELRPEDFLEADRDGEGGEG